MGFNNPKGLHCYGLPPSSATPGILQDAFFSFSTYTVLNAMSINRSADELLYVLRVDTERDAYEYTEAILEIDTTWMVGYVIRRPADAYKIVHLCNRHRDKIPRSVFRAVIEMAIETRDILAIDAVLAACKDITFCDDLLQRITKPEFLNVLINEFIELA